jgi:hypothetical protein
MVSVYMKIYVRNSVFLPVKNLAEETKVPTTKIGWCTLHSRLHSIESAVQQPICVMYTAYQYLGIEQVDVS